MVGILLAHLLRKDYVCTTISVRLNVFQDTHGAGGAAFRLVRALTIDLIGLVHIPQLFDYA